MTCRIVLATATGSPNHVVPGDEDVAVSSVRSPRMPTLVSHTFRIMYVRAPGNGRAHWAANVLDATQGNLDSATRFTSADCPYSNSWLPNVAAPTPSRLRPAMSRAPLAMHDTR